MKLETKRLILRTPKPIDWKDIVEGIGDFDVAKRLASVPHPYKRKDAESWIKRTIKKAKKKNATDYNFSIELKAEKKVIGCIGIEKIDRFSGNGETGSWINKKYWRNGYITEAKIAVNDFAFNKLKLIRLSSPVFSDNEASNRTQLKMGYKLEGTQRKCKRSIATGKLHDTNFYGLLKDEWKKARAGLIKKSK